MARAQNSTVTRPTPQPLRFELAWAALGLLMFVMALGYPALSGQFLVNSMSDMFGTGYAYRVFGAEALRTTGDFAQWNAYILGGIPYIAAQHGDIFYPTFLLRLLLPVDVAITWSFLLHLWLAGLFTFGLIRSFGFSFWPALLGGTAYMMSGQVASLVSPGHDGKMFVSALAPLLLWMIVRAVRDGRMWAWGMIALVTGLAILTPHYQMVYYLALFCVPFTLWMALRGREDPLPRALAWRRVAFAGAAAALGLAIASIGFLPFFEYLDFAARGTERGYEYATSYSMPPEEMLNFYLPHFVPSFVENYWGRNPLKLHNEYVGAVVLLIAGLAFGAPGRRREVWFWGIAAVIATLVALGGHTPFYRLWYLLPMMKVVRAPAMIFYIAQLAIAVFAAIGLERMFRDGVRRGYLIGWGSFAVLIVLLAGAGVLTSIAHTLAPPDKYVLVDENTASLIGGAVRSLLFVGLAIGVILAGARGRISATAMAAALCGLAAADLWSVERRFFRFSPPARELYASDPTIEYLQRLEDPGRVMALYVSGHSARDPVLDGDALIIHRVRAVTGHQGNEFQRWVELAGAKSPVPGPNLFKREFRRLTNTRFWLTDAELPPEHPQLPGMRLIRRVGPVRSAVGNEVWLYELDERNPAAWVAPLVTEAPAEAIRATVVNPSFDVTRAALFDSSEAVDGQPVNVAPPPLELPARVQYLSSREIRVELARPAPNGSALIVSENWYPGWTARVDGQPATVARADYSLIGIPLTAGARRIELSFADPVYARGKIITVIALVVTLALIGGGVVMERRRRV